MLRLPQTLRATLLHGLVIVAALSGIQLLLDALQNGFMLYLPPIGFGFFLVVSYIVQPIIIGVVNVFIQLRLQKSEKPPTTFLLSGLFLLLAFSTINVLLQTMFGISFSTSTAIVETVVLAIPFGYLAKFSIE